MHDTVYRAMQHVLNALQPYLIENGGCIVQEQYIYDENKERGNLILGYLPPSWKVGDKAVSFIGCHFDVVPAIESDWDVPAFKLTSSEVYVTACNKKFATIKKLTTPLNPFTVYSLSLSLSLDGP